MRRNRPRSLALKLPSKSYARKILEGDGVSTLCDELVHDFAGDVGEAEVAALKAVGEFGVVEAQELQEGGVHVHPDLKQLELRRWSGEDCRQISGETLPEIVRLPREDSEGLPQPSR